MREIINFCGGWRFSKEGDRPTVFPEQWQRVELPHTWNAQDGQDEAPDQPQKQQTCAKSAQTVRVAPEAKTEQGMAASAVESMEQPGQSQRREGHGAGRCRAACP